MCDASDGLDRGELDDLLNHQLKVAQISLLCFPRVLGMSWLWGWSKPVQRVGSGQIQQ